MLVAEGGKWGVIRVTSLTILQVKSNIHFKVKESESEVTQLCLTLCDPVDFSLPGSSVHGILQARILEWVAISSSESEREE